MVTVNVPTTLEQKLFGTPVTTEHKLSRRELQTLFYVGRRLELIACYLPMSEPSPRTVLEHKSYGYVMEAPRGRSHLRHEVGTTIIGVSPTGGNGYTEVKILDCNGKVSAHYRLL